MKFDGTEKKFHTRPPGTQRHHRKSAFSREMNEYLKIPIESALICVQRYALMIGRQEETYSDVVPLRGGYRPKRLKSKQLFILQGLPGVGPMLAKRLKAHFGTVSRVMSATVKELTKVEGIGENSANKIREVLDK